MSAMETSASSVSRSANLAAAVRKGKVGGATSDSWAAGHVDTPLAIARREVKKYLKARKCTDYHPRSQLSEGRLLAYSEAVWTVFCGHSQLFFTVNNTGPDLST